MSALWGEYADTIGREVLLLLLVGVVEAIADFKYREYGRYREYRELGMEEHGVHVRRRALGYVLPWPILYASYAFVYVPLTLPLTGPHWPQTIIETSGVTGMFLLCFMAPATFLAGAWVVERRNKRYGNPLPREEARSREAL